MNNERRISIAAVLLALLKAGSYLLLFLGCQMLVTVVVTTAFTLAAVLGGGAYSEALLLEQVLNCTGQITLFSNILTLVILRIFFLARRKNPPAEAGLVPARPRMVAAAAAVTPALYVVIILVLSCLPQAWLESYADASAPLNDTGVWALLATVIAAPLAEEVVFRGLIQSRLRRVMPGWLAVVIAAALFGLCHGQAVWMAYAFTLGLFFGWICGPAPFCPPGPPTLSLTPSATSPCSGRTPACWCCSSWWPSPWWAVWPSTRALRTISAALRNQKFPEATQSSLTFPPFPFIMYPKARFSTWNSFSTRSKRSSAKRKC